MNKNFPILGGLIALVLLGVGCGGGNGGGNGNGNVQITGGSIGGLNFTVLGGEVFQSTTGGPLTAGGSGGTIIFDDTITSLAGGPRVNFQILAVVSDGGGVGILAFGNPADQLNLALGVQVSRSGTDYSYGLFWGFEITPPIAGLFPSLTNPAGPVSLAAEYHNDLSPALIATWDPDDFPNQEDIGCSGPPQGNAGIAGGGIVDQGNGDRAGIGFFKAEISGVVFRSPTTGGC